MMCTIYRYTGERASADVYLDTVSDSFAAPLGMYNYKYTVHTYTLCE
jgi:hypothetical protein